MQTPMRQPGWKIWQLVAVFCLVAVALPAADAAPVPPPAPRWTALWQDSYPTMTDPGFNPERMSAVVAVDRSTGDAYLSMWDHGIWKSSDAGKTFARVDGGKISGRGCGPLFGNSFYVTPADSQLATFNMNNGPGPSGISADGGKTWTAFTACGRNWDIGAIDWTSHVGARSRKVVG